MAPFDRDGALKRAETALRQGRIDAAIEEYTRLVDAYPRDWNSANALGDLFVRAGQIEQGVARYTRIADHFAGEGFYPKAAALYKKVLRFKPEDEHALLQAGEVAARQGLIRDARQLFAAVAEQRRARGDIRGAAEAGIRSGTLDPEDLQARIGAARLAVEIGDTATALREFRDVGAQFEQQGRLPEAFKAWRSALKLDADDHEIRARLVTGYLNTRDLDSARVLATLAPHWKEIARWLETAGRTDEMLDALAQACATDADDLEVRAALVRGYAAKGDRDQARAWMNAAIVAQEPGLWVTIGELDLAGGHFDEGRAAMAQALAADYGQRDAVLACGHRLAASDPDAGYRCLDAVVDACIRQRDYAVAADALQTFVAEHKHHIIGLMRLVEVCVEGRLDRTMDVAQAQLADAYLDAGRALSARIISEDLVSRDPASQVHVDRLRRALLMLGEADPDAIIEERLRGESPFLGPDDLDLNDGTEFSLSPEPEPDVAPAGDPAAEDAHVEADPGEWTSEAVAPDPAGADLAGAASEPLPSLAASAPAAPRESADVSASPALDDLDAEELIDLDAALDDEPGQPGVAAEAGRSLEYLFEDLRHEMSREEGDQAAATQLRLANTCLDRGLTEEAIHALEMASSSHRHRFEASSRLAQLALARGEPAVAVEWLERAAAASAPTPDAACAVLYDLADVLERLGEPARALAIFAELDAESGGYRDVSERLERLSHAATKG